VFVFLGYDPSADGRGVAKDRVIGTSGDRVIGNATNLGLTQAQARVPVPQRFGIGFGWPKGGPSVAQGPRKDGASVRIEEVALFATKDRKKAGEGAKEIGGSGIARDRGSKTYR
jgi:hypothetical protein